MCAVMHRLSDEFERCIVGSVRVGYDDDEAPIGICEEDAAVHPLTGTGNVRRDVARVADLDGAFGYVRHAPSVERIAPAERILGRFLLFVKCVMREMPR